MYLDGCMENFLKEIIKCRFEGLPLPDHLSSQEMWEDAETIREQRNIEFATTNEIYEIYEKVAQELGIKILHPVP